MSDQYWKLKKSRVAGRVPTVGQFDEDTIVFNQADGIIYVMKVVNGVKTVVQISGWEGTHNEPNITITEPLTGLIDGTNTIFSTSMAYKSGTISVFVNGIKEKYFDEISNTQIELKTAPSNVGFTDILETIYTKKTI